MLFAIITCVSATYCVALVSAVSTLAPLRSTIHSSRRTRGGKAPFVRWI